MKNETQALHLEKMMQRHILYPAYELAFPLVRVQSKKLQALSVDDVILTGIDVLEFILIDQNTICANMRLKKMGNRYGLEIIDLQQEHINQSDSKKYKNISIVFGNVQSKTLEIGHTIDMSPINLNNVTLVLEGKTFAEGTLVNVDDEIAIQIKKVN